MALSEMVNELEASPMMATDNGHCHGEEPSAVNHPRRLFETPPPAPNSVGTGMSSLSTSPSSSFGGTSVDHFCGPQEVPPKPLKPNSPFGREALMVANRMVTEVTPGSMVFVDCGNKLTREQVESIKKKAIQLVLVFYSSATKKMPVFVGQAGILIENNKATMYTARHNVANETKKSGGTLSFERSSAHMDGGSQHAVNFKQANFQLTNAKPLLLRDPMISWKYGWDITTFADRSFGPRSPALLRLGDVEPENMFEKVRPDFVYEKGQQVAMVVSTAGMQETATPESANVGRFALQDWVSSTTAAATTAEGGDLSQEQMDGKKRQALMVGLRAIYGPGNAVGIYTGEITHVGTHHIEYNINTFQSCSGATVFLLPVSEGQPESVQHNDLGKAIAVHVGYEELLGDSQRGSNLGLKLHPPSWWKQFVPSEKSVAVAVWLLANYGAFAYCTC